MKSNILLPIFTLVLGTVASPAPIPNPNDPTATTNNPSPCTFRLTPGSGFRISTKCVPTNCAGVQAIGVTRNDLLHGPCKPLTLIFARGTTEGGNIGNIVGPPFIDALNSQLSSAQIAVQGVNDYPADIAGFNEGGSPSGSKNMAQLIKLAKQKCPHTKLCVSGYSQGAQVAHNAVNMMSQAETDFINSAVLWGDPDNGAPFGRVPARKVSTDCHFGDDICLHGNLVLPPHQDYCLDAQQEASFVVQRSGLRKA